MPTIVQYTSTKTPESFYPFCIISPPAARPCCFTDMEVIGESERQGTWEYVYKRCRSCGFAVQVILRKIPDAEQIASLQKTFDRMFRGKKNSF